MGNREKQRSIRGAIGFTLLEILGVILLMGLILTLAQPEWFRSEERTRVRYAGEMLKVDLERARLEAKTGMSMKLYFTSYGYRFQIGDSSIERDYRSRGLTFHLTASLEGEAPAELSFASDGTCNLTTIHWESKHYQGILTFAQEQEVSWRYYAK